MQVDDSELEQVDALFNKYYEFEPLDLGFTLPLDSAEYFSSEIYSIAELKGLKERLNSVKSELDFVNLTHWSKHTDFTSRSRDVVYQIKEQIQPGKYFLKILFQIIIII